MVVLWAKSDCVPSADGPGLPCTGHSEQKEHKWLLSLLGGVLNGLLGRHEQCQIKSARSREDKPHLEGSSGSFTWMEHETWISQGEVRGRRPGWSQEPEGNCRAKVYQNLRALSHHHQAAGALSLSLSFFFCGQRNSFRERKPHGNHPVPCLPSPVPTLRLEASHLQLQLLY